MTEQGSPSPSLVQASPETDNSHSGFFAPEGPLVLFLFRELVVIFLLGERKGGLEIELEGGVGVEACLAQERDLKSRSVRYCIFIYVIQARRGEGGGFRFATSLLPFESFACFMLRCYPPPLLFLLTRQRLCYITHR